VSAAAGRPRLALYLAVGLGSALGGAARWLVADWLPGAPGAGFPWGTLWVNTSGSLLIGSYAALVAPGGAWHQSTGQRLFFMTGFCGGYTTFSFFNLETLWLLQAGRVSFAGMYMAVSVVLWLGAAWAGYALTQNLQGRWGAAR
jgi:fluoride exporter